MKIVIRILVAVVILLLIVALVLLCKYADNTTLQLTEYKITHEKIPAEFHGFRITQVADLHNTEFGDNNSALLSLMVESDPDIIVFTGDQLDARRTNKDVILNLVKHAVQIAPCYLVSGNHEGSIPALQQYHADLEAAGVTVLEDEFIELSYNGAVIDLIGLHDASMNKRFYSHGAKEALEMSLQEMARNKDHYSILLAHRPEYLYVYERNGVDLALCGHNHGGQMRLGDQGLISAGKELFPEYDAGVYTMDNIQMVLSRGLGNSLFPLRINNPPELVVVELSAEQ